MGMIIVIMKIIIGKGGYEPPARGRRYVDCKNQITAIADDCSSRGKINYVQNIVHSIGF